MLAMPRTPLAVTFLSWPTSQSVAMQHGEDGQQKDLSFSRHRHALVTLRNDYSQRTVPPNAGDRVLREDEHQLVVHPDRLVNSWTDLSRRS